MRKPRNKIAEYRMRNLLSQNDVAERLNISQPYYGRLEGNPKKMEVGMLIELKAMFNAESLENLLEETV